MALEGVAAKVRAAVEQAGVPGAAEEQLPLGLDGADEEAGPFGDSEIEVAGWACRRGPGRPRGSRNRRSEDLIQWLLRGYRHPLQELMDAIALGPPGLAEAWQIRRADAAALWARLVAEALPYFESRKPVALQVDTRAIALHVHALEAEGEQTPPWARKLAGWNTDGDTSADQDSEK